jgi:hypothetical protein
MPRTGDLTGSGLLPPGSADFVIGDYLDELAGALIGPAAARAAILAEIGDGILEATGIYRARGMQPGEAARAAITEFGEPHAVAAAFGPGLAAHLARRTALALLASGPLVGAAWIGGAVLAALPPARYELSGAWWALPVVALMLVVAAPNMLLAVITTGRLGLRFTLPASLPPRVAGIASLAAIAADGTLLGMLGLYAVTTPASLPLLPVIPAITLSLARLALAARASRGCLVASAALT